MRKMKIKPGIPTKRYVAVAISREVRILLIRILRYYGIKGMRYISGRRYMDALILREFRRLEHKILKFERDIVKSSPDTESEI